jgi:hypothetical protein
MKYVLVDIVYKVIWNTVVQVNHKTVSRRRRGTMNQCSSQQAAKNNFLGVACNAQHLVF